MDVKPRKKVRRKLNNFLKQFDECIRTAPSCQHLRTYLGCQVSHLDRKSIEPIADDVPMKWLTADAFYGTGQEFRDGAAGLGVDDVVEAPCALKGWSKKPRILNSVARRGRMGRPPTKPKLAPEAPAARRVDEISKRKGSSWKAYPIKDSNKGPVVWEVMVRRFFPWQEGLPGDACRLIVAGNVLDGEVKYFLSNAPETRPVEVLLHVAFRRWRIEHLFEDAKGEMGLDHFEVRHYRPLMRHMILSMVSILFLVSETKRLRGNKSLLERTTGSSSSRSAA